MAFPASYSLPREIENLPGLSFDPSDKKTLYAEDINALWAAILEIQESIGLEFNRVWPVGSIHISVSSTNPATTLGYGTWEVYATGRVLVGIDASDPAFDTVGETGGAKTHTLTISEMPSHNHGPITNNTLSHPFAAAGPVQVGATGAGTRAAPLAPLEGGGQAHNNLQPYIVVYIWRRTA